MNGNINFSNIARVFRSKNENFDVFRICGDTVSVVNNDKGPFLDLRLLSSPMLPGSFSLCAGNEDTQFAIEGFVDGRLKWGGVNLVRNVNGILANDAGQITRGVGMVPSGEVSDQPVLGRGGKYTSPFDGYFVIFGISYSGDTEPFIWCRNNSNHIISQDMAIGNGAFKCAFVPVAVGDVVEIDYYWVNVQFCRFVKARGFV